MEFVFHLVSFPYVKWHLIFTIIPSIFIWTRNWKFLLRYKKTFLYATTIAIIYGVPADLIASPTFRLWYFEKGEHFGNFYLNLPLGEYLFILLAPQLLVSILLLWRRKIYAR